jgi:hypothetical protein
MKYALILGAAASSLALSASAQPTPPTPPATPHVMIMHHGPDLNVDVNHDGWISRAEASAAADRMFDELDVNHDGRLTSADRPVWRDADDHVMAIPDDRNCQTSSTGDGNDRRVTVICRDEAGPGQHAGMPAPTDPNCQTTTEDRGHGERRVTVICHGDEEHADNSRQVERRVIITRNGSDAAAPQVEHGEQRIEREVIIRNDDDTAELPEPPEAPAAPGAPVAPRPPHPPHAPMLMMLFANAEEADTNHDGALSRDEFRAQQLRFFDASDANHDGKIRVEPPPMPPQPPAPPAAPEPPTPPAPPAPHH